MRDSGGLGMKTSSMVLGIIGGAISILFGLFLVLGGVAFLDDSIWEDTYNNYDGVISESELMETNSMAGTTFLSMGICSVVAGILGLVGGCIVKRKNVASGVMMIIAAVLSIFGFFNLVSIVLFVLGGIFALKRETQPVMPPYPQYYAYPQYPQYYQYPQYPQYPQQRYPQQQPAPPTENLSEPPQQQ